MLPNEERNRQQIMLHHADQFHELENLEQLLYRVLPGGEGLKIPRTVRDFDRLVAAIAVGLLSKAIKTSRGIQVLCEIGLWQDANVVLRSLFESYVLLFFILQRSSRKRAKLFSAYLIVLNHKIVEEWKSTDGLKRSARKMAPKVERELAEAAAKLKLTAPNLKKLASNTFKIQAMCRALHWETEYATFYRFASPFAHATDTQSHVAPGREAGFTLFLESTPGPEIEKVLRAASMMVWRMCSRVSHRFGLGFDDVIGAAKPAMILAHEQMRAERSATHRKRLPEPSATP